jgi:hypothetical protein
VFDLKRSARKLTHLPSFRSKALTQAESSLIQLSISSRIAQINPEALVARELPMKKFQEHKASPNSFRRSKLKSKR